MTYTPPAMPPLPAYDRFAAVEYEHMTLYAALARHERNAEFRAILERLVEHERADFEYWRERAQRKEYALPAWKPLLYLMLRSLLGLTFTAKLRERKEKDVERAYAELLDGADALPREEIAALVAKEEDHERMLIGLIREERVARIGNIVLGVNDGLIELTGALVGFTFAFSSLPLAAVSGLITGVAATLSMAASAFMQARYEDGRDPRAAAVSTGASYLAVVVLLVSPYFFAATLFAALATMLAFAVVIVAAVTGYVAVVFERPFARQFLLMLAMSLGVAAASFLLGSAFRALTF